MSLLPTMGSLIATQDTNKQLSSIRSYLSQLQESTEAELMNIGMDNLSGDLKKKLEGMSDDIVVTNESVSDLQGYINANTITAEYLQANYLTASQISSTYVATSVLTANYITANQIASTYVTASHLSANYITASAIASSYVSTNYLSTNYLTADAIATNYLKTSNFTASNIVAKFTESENAIFDRLNARDMRVVVGNNTYPLSWHSVNSGGNIIYFLGTTTNPV